MWWPSRSESVECFEQLLIADFLLFASWRNKRAPIPMDHENDSVENETTGSTSEKGWLLYSFSTICLCTSSQTHSWNLHHELYLLLAPFPNIKCCSMWCLSLNLNLNTLAANQSLVLFVIFPFGTLFVFVVSSLHDHRIDHIPDYIVLLFSTELYCLCVYLSVFLLIVWFACCGFGL